MIEIADVTKQYGGLRPLRIKDLRIGDAERAALLGFDQPAAELFVNLVTGQSLPDSGDVTVFGRSTKTITSSREWLPFVDRFGIASERAVLLEGLTAAQNLAMPFTLSLDPLDAEVRARIEALASEMRLPAAHWDAPVASLDAAAKMRVRLGRALAHGPSLLLLDHVNAGLSARAAAEIAADIVTIIERRRIALVALTVDEAFARAVASRVLRWQPASGRLLERSRWFGGRLG